MSRLVHATGFIFVLACLAAGCRKGTESGSGSPAAGPAQDASASASTLADGIAVIDLNVIAHEIGANDLINESIRKREQELVARLNDFRKELDARVASMKGDEAKGGEDPDAAKVETLMAENRTRLAVQAQAAETQLATHFATLQQQLFNEIRPVAWRIAQARGLNVVMTTNQIYAALPDRDITREVVEEIRRINMKSPDSATSGGNRDETSKPRIAEMPGGGSFLPR